MTTNSSGRRFSIGWRIFIALAILTAVEVALSSAIQPSTPYLLVTSLAKAWLIIRYFMHINQLSRKESDH